MIRDVSLAIYPVCQIETPSSEEHRSFLRRGAMAARFHGEQRRAVAIPHRRSDLNCFSQSRVLCSSSVDGPDGQGRRRWRMRCSNAWNSAGACATSLHHTAGCTLAACIIWHRLQAAGPRLRPQQVMKQCSTHSCLVCFAVPRCHVFVSSVF